MVLRNLRNMHNLCIGLKIFLVTYFLQKNFKNFKEYIILLEHSEFEYFQTNFII